MVSPLIESAKQAFYVHSEGAAMVGATIVAFADAVITALVDAAIAAGAAPTDASVASTGRADDGVTAAIMGGAGKLARGVGNSMSLAFRFLVRYPVGACFQSSL